jgi:hypothetical protein
VAETGTIEPIRLRENDFWHLFADELNAALARLGSQQRQTSAAPQSQQRLADPIGSACQPLEPLRSQLNADDRACVPAKS